MAPSKSLQASIETVPKSVQLKVRQGFGHISSLSPEIRDQLLTKIDGLLESGASSTDLEPYAAFTNLTTSQVASTITALSATIGIVVQDGASTKDFIEAARGVFFEAEDEHAVASIVDRAIAKSPDWNLAFDRRKLANETLPALLSFDVSSDLRLKIENDAIQDAVGVAIIHLDTDARGQEVWFQAARGDVVLMIEHLEKALRHMDLAEQLYTKTRLS